MGKVTDWIKIFEYLEGLDYEARLTKENIEQLFSDRREGFSEALYADEKNLNDARESEKIRMKAIRKEELKERAETAYEAEIFKEEIIGEKDLGAGLFDIEREEIKRRLEERLEGKDDYKSVSEIFESRQNYGESHRERLMQFYTAEKDEKAEAFEEGLLNKVEESKIQKIIQWERDKDKESGRDIKIEMHNVNNVQNEMDIDTVTDMLTERLCELMQKSAEGFYM